MAEIEVQAERAWAGGADAVELRLDGFAGSIDELATFLQAHQNRKWIVTIRGAAEGGASTDGPLERAGKLAALADGSDVLVDFEYADWTAGAGGVREKLRNIIGCGEYGSSRLILSAHEFTGRVPVLLESDVTEALEDKAACLKIAYQVYDIGDSFAAFDHLHGQADVEHPGLRRTTIAMGEDGLWTRVLAKKLGAFASYCSLGDATAAGQLTLEEMVHRYRFHSIDASTQVFGVIGDPVAHSMSPLLFNHWFAVAGINAIYLPLRVSGSSDMPARFLAECRERDWLDIGGFSVTIPHKTTALKWAVGGVDPIADSIGAVNTLSFREGTVTAHNTDSDAAVSAMIDALGLSQEACADLTVDILGIGGAARAVMHGVHELGCTMTVYGRSIGRTQRIAQLFHAHASDWEQRVGRSGDVVINCTSLGMWPDINASPLPEESLRGCSLVYDLVYNPLETQLLRTAKRAGVRTLSGLEMFLRQAAMQFELWTGKSPDTKRGRALIEAEIAQRSRE
jgi:3-dehydroquinate dehydratase/shikimate dehydrogenase